MNALVEDLMRSGREGSVLLGTRRRHVCFDAATLYGVDDDNDSV